MQTQLFHSSPPLSSISYKPYRRVSITATAARSLNHPVAAHADTMYELLSVETTAGPSEIKAAYRRQAKKWHPDVCSSSADKSHFTQQFMKAKKAYEVLCDPILREDYDLALRAGIPSSGKAAGLGGLRPFEKKEERARGGFGDWEGQLEELLRRSSQAETRVGRNRRSNASGASDL